MSNYPIHRHAYKLKKLCLFNLTSRYALGQIPTAYRLIRRFSAKMPFDIFAYFKKRTKNLQIHNTVSGRIVLKKLL
jgi:hypothetical protein